VRDDFLVAFFYASTLSVAVNLTSEHRRLRYFRGFRDTAVLISVMHALHVLLLYAPMNSGGGWLLDIARESRSSSTPALAERSFCELVERVAWRRMAQLMSC
jgi:hypothetical protein